MNIDLWENNISISLYGGFRLVMRVAPNHPSHDHISIETHGFGDPPFQEPPR